MIEFSKKICARALLLLPLALAACSADTSNIPCADDSSCPVDVPVCSGSTATAPGRCIAGTSTGSASVALVGVVGHAASEFVSGTVQVLVTARAKTGVQAVTLTSGTQTFNQVTTNAPLPPAYAFDVDTTTLANADATLTASVKAGDGSSATATGTVHVDNAKPAITSFQVAGATSATITSGTSIALTATFTGGTGSISASTGGSTTIASGGSVLVSPDAATTYTLHVTSRSGVAVQTGATGQPGNVIVNVAGPVQITSGAFSVSPATITQDQTGTFTFTAPSFNAAVSSAVIRDGNGTAVQTIASGGTAAIPIPNPSGTAPLTYTLVLSNAANTPHTVSTSVVIPVGTQPAIGSFTGTTTITSGSSATIHADYAGGNAVINPGAIPVPASPADVVVSPTAPTTSYTLTVTNPTTGVSATSAAVTVTVVAAPAISSFESFGQHVSSGDSVSFDITATNTVGDASVTGSCTGGITVPPFPITIAGGFGTAAQNAPTVTAPGTLCTYSATVHNAAGTQAQVPLSVRVEPLPTIASFTLTSGTPVNPGTDVVLNASFNEQGGSADVNGILVATGPRTFFNIQQTTTYTLTVTNLAGRNVFRQVTVTVNPFIDDFSVGVSQPTATNAVTIAQGASTTLFATFHGSGTFGTSPGTIACTPSCNSTLVATSIASGASVVVNGSVLGTLTYTLSIGGATGGSATRQVAVTVVPPATAVSLTAGSSTIAAGTSTTLTPVFSFGGGPAGRATIAGDDGTTFSNLTSGTAVSAAPSTTTTYTLTVFDAAGVAGATLRTATITVVTQGAWTALNTTNVSVRRGATVTAVGGNVLIAGGLDAGGTPQSSVVVCTAAGACAAPGGAMSSVRAFHSATLITSGFHAGQVLLAGGFTNAALTSVTATADFYDPGGNTITASGTDLSSGRARHFAVLLGDGSNVLFGCGTADGTTPLKTTLRYVASTATPTIVATTDTGTARIGATATLLGATSASPVLVAGGAVGSLTLELFDPAANTFGTAGAGTMPTGENKRFHSAVLLGGTGGNGGKVLLSGGVTGAGSGTPVATQFLWSTGGTVTQAPSLTTPRSNHAVAALASGAILACGGTSTGSDTLSSCDAYSAEVGTGAVVKATSMLIGRKDFGLAPITISTVPEIFAAGGTSVTTTFAEAFNPN
jgi:hypothetical protein